MKTRPIAYAIFPVMTKCGYCKRELRSVVYLLPYVKPVCGNASCLAFAYRDFARETSAKQAA